MFSLPTSSSSESSNKSLSWSAYPIPASYFPVPILKQFVWKHRFECQGIPATIRAAFAMPLIFPEMSCVSLLNVYGKSVASVHDRFPLCTNASKKGEKCLPFAGGSLSTKVNIHEKWRISAILDAGTFQEDQDLPVSILN